VKRARRRRLRRAAAILGALATLSLAALMAVGDRRATLHDPEPTILVLDRHDRFLTEIAASSEDGVGYWPLAELPERVVAATLAIEDRRFARHPGVDPIAVVRAALQNIRTGRRVSGASTIAMQVARLQTPGPRTWSSKTVESATALGLVRRHGRSAILAQYLRLAPYGNRIHGIAYAARRYFAKPVDDLSWAETALLTALPKAPGRMNPYSVAGRRRAKARAQRILDHLHRDGTIDPATHELATAQLVSLRPPRRPRRPLDAMHAVLRLEQRIRATAGLSRRAIVHATLDLDVQTDVAARTFAAVEGWEARGAGNAAVCVLDRARADVIAWVGSTGYFDEAFAGAIDYTSVARSAGSTLKPFLYALALDRALITPATVLDDLRRGPGGIENSDRRFLGPMLPRAALANSRNVPAARLVETIGVAEAYAFLGELGLHDGRDGATRHGAGLAIGTLPVTLEDLVAAYAALADDGRLQRPRWLVGSARAPARRVLSEEAARQVALWLSDPQARLPTFPRMGASEYPFAAAVKTGTSSARRDAWTVAWSRRFVVGVWVGHPQHRPMKDLTGYRSAARLAQDVLLALQPDELDGLDDHGFPPPRGYRSQRLCALTGRLATRACDHVTLEWFAAGTEPQRPCRAHVYMAVDRRDGRPATATTEAAVTEVRTFVELAPRYGAWAASAGLLAPPRPPLPGRPGPRASEPRLRILSPADGTRLLLDPETPPRLATLALTATSDRPVDQITWYVDGQPFEVADAPFTTRWRMTPGEHVFEARLPFGTARSRRVRVTVE